MSRFKAISARSARGTTQITAAELRTRPEPKDTQDASLAQMTGLKRPRTEYESTNDVDQSSTDIKVSIEKFRDSSIRELFDQWHENRKLGREVQDLKAELQKEKAELAQLRLEDSARVAALKKLREALKMEKDEVHALGKKNEELEVKLNSIKTSLG